MIYYSQFTVETAKERLTIIYVTIEEQTINPTNEQAQASVRVCQILSNTYKDIHLFRFDIQTRDIYILAGENIQIIIPHNGNWRFLNETEL
ncbi:DUF6888 family protein [Nostoc sp. 'Peltigera membranacea cyanobiont' 210A]|uniref:DUF6888 family protein n=1 Tax=Nostoc sp. 'Peltigera membranacea cyanobiont' 210A TaxID=2014529 RepID=UPI003FA5EB54